MQPQPRPDHTAPEEGFERDLSLAIDRARLQLEAAQAAGDEDLIIIFGRQLADLESLIHDGQR